jgi:hypothetical protein
MDDSDIDKLCDDCVQSLTQARYLSEVDDILLQLASATTVPRKLANLDADAVAVRLARQGLLSKAVAALVSARVDCVDAIARAHDASADAGPSSKPTGELEPLVKVSMERRAAWMRATAKLTDSSPGPSGLYASVLKRMMTRPGAVPAFDRVERSLRPSGTPPACLTSFAAWALRKEGKSSNRPIASPEAAFKLLEHFWLVQPVAHDASTMRHGAQHLTGCVMALQREGWHAVEVDLTKAFDNVRHDLAAAALAKAGWCDKAAGAYLNLIRHRTLYAPSGEAMAPRDPLRGLPQGGVASPAVFITTLQYALPDSEARVLRYLDNLYFLHRDQDKCERAAAVAIEQLADAHLPAQRVGQGFVWPLGSSPDKSQQRLERALRIKERAVNVLGVQAAVKVLTHVVLPMVQFDQDLGRDTTRVEQECAEEIAHLLRQPQTQPTRRSHTRSRMAGGGETGRHLRELSTTAPPPPEHDNPPVPKRHPALHAVYSLGPCRMSDAEARAAARLAAGDRNGSWWCSKCGDEAKWGHHRQCVTCRDGYGRLHHMLARRIQQWINGETCGHAVCKKQGGIIPDVTVDWGGKRDTFELKTGWLPQATSPGQWAYPLRTKAVNKYEKAGIVDVKVVCITCDGRVDAESAAHLAKLQRKVAKHRSCWFGQTENWRNIVSECAAKTEVIGAKRYLSNQ